MCVLCAVGQFRELVEAAEKDRPLCETLKKVLKLTKVPPPWLRCLCAMPLIALGLSCVQCKEAGKAAACNRVDNESRVVRSAHAHSHMCTS